MSDLLNPFELIRTVADHVAMRRILISGNRAYIPGGVNGPYFDIETPIRNTAHWLITYSILAGSGAGNKYREIAHQLLNFLLEPGEYRKNGIYIHRQKSGKDWTNGVIGQAWVVEALAIAGELLDNDIARINAQKYASVLEFDTKVGAWNRPKLAGYKQQIDFTLNHQLWFATAMAEAFAGQQIDEINIFLSKLAKGGFRIRKDGRVCHLLYSFNSMKGLLLQARYALMEKRYPDAVMNKEVGYHLYNLYPLARLRDQYPDHKFFTMDHLKKAISYSVSDNFLNSIKTNHFSYNYNSPAFEFPLILHCFRDIYIETDLLGGEMEIDNKIEKQLKYQLDLTYDEDVVFFASKNPDPITLTSRIYELALWWGYRKNKV